MNSETERKLAFWLSCHPESNHPLDRLRMYDFVREACLHEDNITDSAFHNMVVAAKPEWTEEVTERFVDDNIILIEHLMEFYNFCKDNIQVDEEDSVGRIMVKSIEDFMEESGDLNYYELYELVMAIQGYKEALTYFSVDDKDDIRTIVYDIMNVGFEFQLSEVKSLTQWIEDNYMDGLDADSWYGFMDAMERNKFDKFDSSPLLTINNTHNMKAKVQYNDFVGTSAADISDFYHNSIENYLIENFSKYDPQRFMCQGCSIYVSGQLPTPKASIDFVCFDREQKKYVKLCPLKDMKMDDVFSLFKRFQVVIGKDMESIEVNDNDWIDLE